MMQSSSARTRLAASHKVAGSTSKVEKRVVAIADPSKKGGPQSAYTSPIFGRFLGRNPIGTLEGYTHAEANCPRCRVIRLRPIDQLPKISMGLTLDQFAQWLRCAECGGPA